LPETDHAVRACGNIHPSVRTEANAIDRVLEVIGSVNSFSAFPRPSQNGIGVILVPKPWSVAYEQLTGFRGRIHRSYGPSKAADRKNEIFARRVAQRFPALRIENPYEFRIGFAAWRRENTSDSLTVQTESCRKGAVHFNRR